MKLFEPVYNRALIWAQHRHATWWLAFISFIEAVIFPIPPEVMLAPMSLAQPRRAFWFAAVSLTASTLGALVGYALGHFAFDLLEPWLHRLGYWDTFLEVKQHAIKNGFWLLLIGGFTPIPFKLLTIASGAVGMPLLPFLAGAIIGRGKRVFLIAAAIRLGGERAERTLRRYVEPIGWMALVLLTLLIAYIVLKH
ncbi:MAG: YqaA family protein [Lysobacterales bacterium]